MPEPAAALPATAGHRTELMTALAESLPDLVLELGREGAAADARGVGFDDSEHEARRAWTHAAARSGRACDRVGRGDEGVSAVVDVEQHALRALEEDTPAATPGLVQVAPDGPGKGKHEICDALEVVAQPVAIDRRPAEAGTKMVMMGA